jgi:hypothetical protein
MDSKEKIIEEVACVALKKNKEFSLSLPPATEFTSAKLNGSDSPRVFGSSNSPIPSFESLIRSQSYDGSNSPGSRSSGISTPPIPIPSSPTLSRRGIEEEAASRKYYDQRIKRVNNSALKDGACN